MAQVVEAQIGDLGIFDDLLPGHAEFLGAPSPITAGFSPEDEVGIQGADRIIQGGCQYLPGLLAQRYGAGAAVFGMGESYHPVFEIDLVTTQAGDFAGPHAVQECRAHDPAQHGIGVLVSGLE